MSRPYDVKDPKAYGVKVVGDSMIPMFRPGRKVVVSPNLPVANGDAVYVQLKSGERLIKIARRAAGGFILESINPAYEPRFVKKSEIDLIHPIVWARVKE
jgi:phage repressor protein C with HTH and peptisase S24 domain